MSDDRQVTDVIFALLEARADDATICPSEVARAIDPDRWRPLLADVRAVARRLVEEGRLEIRQRGKVMDIDGEIKGAIRLGLPSVKGSARER